MSIATELTTLIVYRNLLQDAIVKKLLLILSDQDTPGLRYECTGDLLQQAESLGLQGDIVKEYLLRLIAREENIYSLTCEQPNRTVGSGLETAARRDLAILFRLVATNFSRYFPPEFLSDYHPSSNLPPSRYSLDFAAQSPQEFAEKLTRHYRQNGCGDMAGYAAFRWQAEAGLAGIAHFDSIRLEDIIGYDRQKKVLIANTEAFVASKPANHVLLSGARGTGKSSSVKALVNQYFPQGLRLVEVPKQHLKHLSQIMDLLRPRGKKFIIFLDDLSFEDSETEYKHLKSIIEGGVEAKPDNVIIYATSNRRHLIKENWSDRSDNAEEVHQFDTVNEKISLSDRFGITLTYLAPDQDEYLDIVAALAKKHHIDLPYEQLKTEAVRWELAHTGRSGRSARQLINYWLGNPS